jgi:hypothetical protein
MMSGRVSIDMEQDRVGRGFTTVTEEEADDENTTHG